MNKVKEERVTDLSIIMDMIAGKTPYYSIRYRNVGENDYNIGYNSFNLKTVLDFIDECFEIVESGKPTNADKIRNMSDEELAEFLCKVKSDYQWMEHEFPSEEEHGEWKEWLQSEAE